jgi:photosystem II stability/assembly factor-like uncharacterized protein
MKLSFLILSLFAINLQAQTSLRGLSVVNKTTAWCSGSNGTVQLCTNGQDWEDVSPMGYNTKDFRAIHAYDKSTALILSIADSTVILRTINSGKNWELVYENNTPGIFFDDFVFEGGKGFALADPMPEGTDHHHPFIITNDSGKTWNNFINRIFYYAHPQAGLFSASASNALMYKQTLMAIVGGPQAYFLSSQYGKVALPIKSGGAYGPYSIAQYKKCLVVVGGSYAQKDYKDSIGCYSTNLGKTWQTFKTMPNGYKSSIKYFKKRQLIAVGTTGIDVSTNHGKSWKNISNNSYNTVEVYKNSIWLVGNNGLKIRFTASNLKKLDIPF